MNKKENAMIEPIMEATADEAILRPYILRPMKDRDLYPVLGIITKVFPDDLAAMFMQLASGEKSAAEVGAATVIQLCLSVLKNVDRVENELYSFLSDVSGVPEDELRDMPFGTTPMMIMDIAGDVKNASFFKVVSKLF